jgi:hypothetical protein
MSSHFEKSPLSSKKFLAFLIAELAWKVILGLMLYFDVNMALILSTVFVTGFVEVGFILGQAQLDRFIRLAALATPKTEETTKNTQKHDLVGTVNQIEEVKPAS